MAFGIVQPLGHGACMGFWLDNECTAKGVQRSLAALGRTGEFVLNGDRSDLQSTTDILSEKRGINEYNIFETSMLCYHKIY